MTWAICLGVMLGLARAAAAADGAIPPRPEAPPRVEHGQAEVRFPTPVRYAIVRQPPGPVQVLYAAGDGIFHPKAPTPALTVVWVEAGHLLVREGAWGRPLALRPGDPLPGLAGHTVAGTVLVDVVHYRYRRVERIVHLDPVLVSLEGSRAVMEMEVARPAASGPPLEASGLARVPIRELAADRYEVRATDVHAALENTVRVLAELAPGVVPSYSSAAGLQYRITSAASDGVLGRQGFTVTAPKLAERAGIEVGDTILSVNGVPVDGFASFYRIYQQVRRTPALATVQVELERGGSRLTKTYRVR